MKALLTCRGAALFLAILCGCASNPMPEIRGAFDTGDYLVARDQLIAAREADPSNDHVFALEQALVELALGNPGVAEAQLRSARDALDDHRDTSASSWLGAALADDRQLDYGGADYEHVLVRALLAAINLVNGNQDADAYALQVLERQREIIDNFGEGESYNPKKAYKLVAFGSYLRGIINEEDPVHLDSARRSFEKVLALEPKFAFAKEDLRRSREGQHSAKGNGVVHIIALVGHGPTRIETQQRIGEDALALAQAIWVNSSRRAALLNTVSVPIPELAYRSDNPDSVHVFVDGQPMGETAAITDIERTAQVEFKALREHAIARALLRRAFKIAITEGAKEAIENDPEDPDYNRTADIGISIAGFLWTAAEAADLRCWSLLPATLQVTRIEMPAGEYNIALRSGRRGTPTGVPQTVRVLVRDGFNTYVLAQVPTLNGGPPPLTSDPAQVSN